MRETTMIADREQLLRDPQPGTAAAAARDFGIDLTLTIEHLRLSPEQRIRRLDSLREGIRKIKAALRPVTTHDRD